MFVLGRSRMTINPRIPTMPGRSTSGFHQPGRHCLHQAQSAVRCSASRMKGELHPSKNRSKQGLRHLVPTFLLMDDSANELLCFWCGHSSYSNGGGGRGGGELMQQDTYVAKQREHPFKPAKVRPHRLQVGSSSKTRVCF